MIKKIFTVILINGPAVLFGWMQMPTQMLLCIIAGSISSAFLYIDSIKLIKGAGFEARMQDAIKEAYATTESMRQLAKPLINTTVTLLATTNRWGGMNFGEKHSIHDELEKLGKKLQIDNDSDIQAAHEMFYRFHTWDLYHKFTENLRLINDIPAPTRDILIKLQDYISNKYPSIDDIKKILGNDIEKLTLPAKEAIDDYIYYTNYHKLRRPELKIII